MADTETAYEPRLKRVYREEVRKALMDQFSYGNEMELPRVDKIVINMGVGEANGRFQEADGGGRGSCADRRPEAGHLPMRVTRSPASRSARACRSARRSRCARTRCTSSWIGSFRSRFPGFAISAVSIPRASTAVATSPWAMKEHIVFPRDQLRQGRSRCGAMDIIVCTTAKTDDEARGAFESVQLPVPPVTNACNGRRTKDVPMAKKKA